jgi:hypothetical protein
LIVCRASFMLEPITVRPWYGGSRYSIRASLQGSHHHPLHVGKSHKDRSMYQYEGLLSHTEDSST